MPEAKPLVWIVILHWRGVEHTRACLNSLESLTYSNYKVLLVDNGSSNKDGAKLQEDFPQIELLELDSNRGFSGGCNAGIDVCLNKKADFVWLLNNDATVHDETLSKLVSAIESGTKIGAASAAILDGEHSDNDLESRLGVGKIDFANAKALLRAAKTEENVSCDWISGSNMLLTAKALEEVGGLNDDYFLYFEDVEICTRLRKNGYSCLFVPSATINHVDGASTKGDFVHWRYYYHCRNRLIFFSGYPSLILRVYCTLRIMLHLLRHILVLPFRGLEAKKKLNIELKASKDFLSGIRGKVDLQED